MCNQVEGIRADEQKDISFKLENVLSTTSTNDIVKLAIDGGEREGFAVRADEQTGGYGRRGNKWSSPPGGMYLSVLLDPATHIGSLPDYLRRLSTLPLAIGVAVRRAVLAVASAESDKDVALKWPNDIVVMFSDAGSSDDSVSSAHAVGGTSSTRVNSGASPAKAVGKQPLMRKLCGISVEVHKGKVCVGIGINVHRNPKHLQFNQSESGLYDRELAYVEDMTSLDTPDPFDPSNTSHSLDERTSVQGLSLQVLDELAQVYDVWLHESFSALVDEYNLHNALAGKRIRVSHDGEQDALLGVVAGVDEWGHLLILQDDGEEFEVSSGEVHIVAA